MMCRGFALLGVIFLVGAVTSFRVRRQNNDFDWKQFIPENTEGGQGNNVGNNNSDGLDHGNNQQGNNCGNNNEFCDGEGNTTPNPDTNPGGNSDGTTTDMGKMISDGNARDREKCNGWGNNGEPIPADVAKKCGWTVDDQGHRTGLIGASPRPNHATSITVSLASLVMMVLAFLQ